MDEWPHVASASQTHVIVDSADVLGANTQTSIHNELGLGF
jgi:hypothetical protein